MRKSAFTAIELLAVLAIILTIVGIGIPAYNSFRNRGRLAKARALIQQIEMALEMYKTDNEAYPDNRGNLNGGALIDYINNYATFKEEDLNGSIIVDPWDRPYVVYVDNDGDPSSGPSDFRYNRSACYIYSKGPDENNPNDDIDNYKM